MKKFRNATKGDLQKTETFWSNAHFVEISAKLQEFFDNQQFCDVTLISADGAYKIKAHKNVLASVSKYFLAMFGGSLCEAEQNEVVLSLLNGGALKVILNFIYKGLIELTADSVESVLEGAHMLELNALEKICCAYMMKNIDVSNCLGIMYFSKQHNYGEMYKAAASCACEKFVALRQQEEFHSLQLDQLCELISNEDIRKPSEGEVFHAVMAWINHKRDERKQCLEKLLSCIRFHLLPPSFIARFIEKECDTWETSRIVCKALAWHALPENSFSQKQTEETSLKTVIVAIGGFENNISVALNYPGSNEWVYAKWPPLPLPRKNVKYTVEGKKLIIGGGVAHSHFSNCVDCLDMETLEWTQFPMLPISQITCLVPLNGTVYVFGKNCLYKLAEPFAEWTTVLVNAEFLRDVTACAAHKNLIYFPSNSFVATYDTVENKFNLEKIKRKSDSYVVGMHIVRHLGSDYLIEITKNEVYAYDLNSLQLAVMNTSPFPRISSTTSHGGCIIMNRRTKLCVYDIFEKTLRDDLPPIKGKKEIEAVLTYNI